MTTLERPDAWAEVTLHFRLRLGNSIDVLLTEEQARDVVRRLNLAFHLSAAAITQLEELDAVMWSLSQEQDSRIDAVAQEMEDRYAAMGEYAEWAKGRIAALEARLGLPRDDEGRGAGETDPAPTAPPQSGAPYSEEEIERIRALLERGKKPKFIGAAIGRSEASVYQKINGTPDLLALYNPEKAAKEKETRDMLGSDAAADGGG